jgi:hypothetical protein
MKIKTPSRAPTLDDKNLTTFLQFMRDDVTTLSKAAEFYVTRTLKMLPNAPQDIVGDSNLAGAIPIANTVSLDTSTVELKSDGGLRVTVGFAGAQTAEVTWLVIKK